MAEYIQEIAAEPANKSAAASGDASHYSLPIYEWFGNESTDYGLPNSITADFGDARDPYYVSTNKGDVQRTGPIFSTPEVPDNQRGFDVKKTSTSNVHSIIIEIRGGIGHWMPAPIFRTMSFFWQNQNNANSNYRVYTPGLILRNWRTNAQKYWSVGWENAADPNPGGKLYKVSGLAKAEQINALGPDWYIYGAWFYLLSNQTQAAQTTASKFADLRLGWHNPLPSGTYKMIIPEKMSWDDFRAMKLRDEAAYYVRPDA